MKKILLTILIALPSMLSAQPLYNPYVSGGTIVPAPMALSQQGGSALITFTFGNNGTAALPFVTGQGMTLNFTLLRGVANAPTIAQAVSGTMSQYFTWTGFGGALTATQNQPIPANISGNIVVNYLATSNSLITSQTNGLNVNIGQSPLIAGHNIQADDNTSVFTYTQASALAVDVSDLSGQKLIGFNKLNWTTLSEKNSHHFNLYYGQDNSKMSKLIEVPSKAMNGISENQLNYSYNHNSPLLGDNYYRLSSVDNNGNEDFHNTINIFIREKSTLTVAPNPTLNGINIHYSNGELDMLNVTLSDVQGKTIYRKRILFKNGTFNEWIAMDSLPSGTYLLNITDFEGYNYSQKVVKE